MEIVYPHLMIDLCLCKWAIGNKRGVRKIWCVEEDAEMCRNFLVDEKTW